MSVNLWDHDTPVTELDIDVPAWIEQDITPADIAAIIQGGCESGAYMPAVTYHQTHKTMLQHGDAICQYIEDSGLEVPSIRPGMSWDGYLCNVVSLAVELWASAVEGEIEEALEALEEEGDDDA
jgi:hypothetical protein